MTVTRAADMAKWTSNQTKKFWGHTRPLIVKDVFQEHELLVDAGGYCSCHWHSHRANRFIVDSGCIGVVWFRGWKWDRHILTQGDKLDVPSQVTHRFEVYETGRVFEEYWPDRHQPTIETSDITRIVVGGKLEFKPHMTHTTAQMMFDTNIRELIWNRNE